MQVQLENRVMSSLMLYVDHFVSEKGAAYARHGSAFHQIEENYEDYEVWAAPFKQMVCDDSVTYAIMLSGVYVNGSSSESSPSDGPSSADIAFINPYQGQVFFHADRNITSVSGDYEVKDFNVYLTNENEEELLFETQFDIRPKVTQTPTGLASEKQTFPAIYIKNNGGTNEPFAFGGMDTTSINARMIVLADSAFSLDAVCGILKDRAKDNMPVILEGAMPFNAAGGIRESSYLDPPNVSYFNYKNLVRDHTEMNFFIENAYVTKISPNRQFYKNINKDVFSAFIDFDLETQRYPRA